METEDDWRGAFARFAEHLDEATEHIEPGASRAGKDGLDALIVKAGSLEAAAQAIFDAPADVKAEALIRFAEQLAETREGLAVTRLDVIRQAFPKARRA